MNKRSTATLRLVGDGGTPTRRSGYRFVLRRALARPGSWMPPRVFAQSVCMGDGRGAWRRPARPRRFRPCARWRPTRARPAIETILDGAGLCRLGRPPRQDARRSLGGRLPCQAGVPTSSTQPRSIRSPCPARCGRLDDLSGRLSPRVGRVSASEVASRRGSAPSSPAWGGPGRSSVPRDQSRNLGAGRAGSKPTSRREARPADPPVFRR